MCVSYDEKGTKFSQTKTNYRGLRKFYSNFTLLPLYLADMLYL